MNALQDSVRAALLGMAGGEDYPAEWISGIWDWPRNLFFLLIVLGHGFARLVPRRA